MKDLDVMDSMEKMLVQKAYQRQAPVNGSLELLPLCNMNCDMCYVRLSKAEMEQKGRLRTKEEWIKLAHQMKDAGTLFLLLTGGEPLLFPGFKELYIELQNMGMILTINTNGTLIDEEWADFFQKYKPRRMNITLYGADDQAYEQLCHYPGGFQKTVNAVRLLRDREIDVKINGSITSKNEEDIRKILDIADDLDAAVNLDTYMYPASRERNKPFDDQSRMNPKDAAMAKKLIFQHQWGEEALRISRSCDQHGRRSSAKYAIQQAHFMPCRQLFFYDQLAGDDAPMCDAKSTRSECICRRFSKKLGNDISTDERNLDQ